MLDELPSEILFHILGYGCDDITSLAKLVLVNQRFHQIINSEDNFLWKHICEENGYYEAEVLTSLGETNPYKGVAVQHFLLENRKHTYVDRSSMETKPVDYAQQRLEKKHKKFNNWILVNILVVAVVVVIAVMSGDNSGEDLILKKNLQNI
jgi:hypothetical protein